MSSVLATRPAEPTAIPWADPSDADLGPRSADGLMVSEETYWADYYSESDVQYEWNNGRLEEKPVSDYETGLVYRWFILLLDCFLKSRPIAQTTWLQMGFRLGLASGTSIRKPDFGVVRNDNPQPLLPRDCSYRGIFDLCVEALSDLERRDIRRDTVTKKAEYAAAGVSEYCILHHETRFQAFYSLASTGLYVPIVPQGGLIRSQVLPGFQFRLSDLGARPALEAMRDDPVYAAFVLPQWRADRDRATTEARRADAEAQRADAEAQRADAESQRADAEAQRADVEAQARRDAEVRAAADAQERLRLERELAQLRARLGPAGPAGPAD